MEKKLTLRQAKSCLNFANAINTQGQSEEMPLDMPPEEFENFMADLQSFVDYMKMTTEAELQIISIPERYERIYGCMKRAASICGVIWISALLNKFDN